MFKKFLKFLNAINKRKLMINFLILTVLYIGFVIELSSGIGDFIFEKIAPISQIRTFSCGIYIFTCIIIVAEAYLSKD